MKNKILLWDKKEIEDFVYSQWSDDGVIKRSHGHRGSLINTIVKQFASTPRIFFEASDKELEWTHFSTWWGAILRPDDEHFENPVIRDLRYLHEIYHGVTFPYVANLDFDTMVQRNFENERLVSAFTEMAIYLEFPQLREQTFSHPIFADTAMFRDDDSTKYWKTMWQENSMRTMQELMFIRMSAHNYDQNDPQVIWLRRYAEQNKQWANIWKSRYNEVDLAMLKLRKDSQVSARDALNAHDEWLQSVSINDIPFYEEAVSFRKVFDGLLVEYEEAMNKEIEHA